MLQSQFTANAQHPDKYDGQEFESRKATHLPLDGSKLTLEEIRFLEANAFKFPQLAEKYKVHEVMVGLSDEDAMTAHKAQIKKKRDDMLAYIGDRLVPFQELVENFIGSKSGISNHLQKLVSDGLLVRELGPRNSVLYRRLDCDTLSS